MTDACKQKAAAASINWMVGLIKNKSGAEHEATRATLEAMFTDMVEKNCNSCKTNGDCHELDAAQKVLFDRSKPMVSSPTASSASPGALLLRRMSRRNRLGRAPAR